MTELRVGTRGSDLALIQTRWVCDLLRKAHPTMGIEEVIIQTAGDRAPQAPMDENWLVGSFVSALEAALVENRIDFAVHSYKDLPSQSPKELVIAAVPEREVVHDVLVTRESHDLDSFFQSQTHKRIGTSSPRRSAQLSRSGNIEIVPIRGNVPTRLRKLQQKNLDAIVLAAAGLKRLGIAPEHAIELPTDRFVPTPAQGALAVQCRTDSDTDRLLAALDHAVSRKVVDAERSFLKCIGAGCQTPIAALAHIEGDAIKLQAQLFSEDHHELYEAIESGTDPFVVGSRLADRIMRQEGEMK